MDDRLDIVIGLLDKLTADHIHGADDQRLRKLEALTYHWQQMAAAEISRRKNSGVDLADILSQAGDHADEPIHEDEMTEANGYPSHG